MKRRARAPPLGTGRIVRKAQSSSKKFTAIFINNCSPVQFQAQARTPLIAEVNLCGTCAQMII